MTGTTILVGLGAVLAANHLTIRTGLGRRYPALFWAVVVLDVVLAVGVLLVGAPGLPGLARVLMALVLTMHVAQDFRLRQTWMQEDRDRELDAEYAEHERLTRSEPPG